MALISVLRVRLRLKSAAYKMGDEVMGMSGE
jgi:hypothetical protein